MIIRLMLTLAILYLAYRVAKYIFQLSDEGTAKNLREIASDDLVRDPQCGTYVPKGSAVKASVGGEEHCFCSEECRNRYRQAYQNKH